MANPPHITSFQTASESSTRTAVDGWDETPRPWRRLFARLLDVQVNLLLFALVAILTAVIFDEALDSPGPGAVADLAPMFILLAAFFGMLVAFPALCLGLFGTTIGKWVLGIRVLRREGYGIGFSDALARELAAVLVGAGLYVPMAMHVAMAVSYVKLTRDGVRLWDQSKPWTVMVRPLGVRQIVGTAAAVLLMPVCVLALRILMNAFEAY